MKFERMESRKTLTVQDILDVFRADVWNVKTYNETAYSIACLCRIEDYMVERFALIRMAMILSKMETGAITAKACYQILIEDRRDIAQEVRLITAFSEKEACRTALDLLPDESEYSKIAASARMALELVVEAEYNANNG